MLIKQDEQEVAIWSCQIIRASKEGKPHEELEIWYLSQKKKKKV